VNRTELQQLAELRMKEAKALLDAGCFEGAYYLAGYAVECAIKSGFAKKTVQYDFPDKKVVNQIYDHNPVNLIKAAGLEREWEKELKASAGFRTNWNIVKDWTEESRYKTKVEEKLAQGLYDAITDPRDGVMAWLKKHW